MALKRKLYKKGDKEILEVKETVMSFSDTQIHHYYSGKQNGNWYRLTNPTATEQGAAELFEKDFHENFPAEYPESCEWMGKYHYPKAEIINLL